MKEEIAQTLRTMEKVIDEYSYGWANDEALNKLKALASQLRWQVDDVYFHEKINSAITNAEILYSARKHKNYNGGAESVVSFVRADIKNARTRLNRIFSNDDS